MRYMRQEATLKKSLAEYLETMSANESVNKVFTISRQICVFLRGDESFAEDDPWR